MKLVLRFGTLRDLQRPFQQLQHAEYISEATNKSGFQHERMNASILRYFSLNRKSTQNLKCQSKLSASSLLILHRDIFPLPSYLHPGRLHCVYEYASYLVETRNEHLHRPHSLSYFHWQAKSTSNHSERNLGPDST